MSRLLILGTGPLLEPGVVVFGAHGLRTWHLTKPLIDAGHDLLLFTLPIPQPPSVAMPPPGVEERTVSGFPYKAFLDGNEAFALAELERTAKSFAPDGMIAINTGPAGAMSRMTCRVPMWADLNGSAIVEGQIRSRVYGHNAALAHHWANERDALGRADRFSAVSLRQTYMLYGELAALGRMNRWTFDHPFAVHVPNAFNPFHDTTARRGTLRGSRVPEDAFAVLWSGGYNAWTDYDALLEGLCAAMDACPRLHYVSTGGAVHGHNDVSLPMFERAIGECRHRDRFHMLGWVDTSELPGIYADCDLGLCIDSANHESLFGARNRTINMMIGGLPVLTTTHAEIGAELVDAGCALSCGGGTAGEISERLAWAAEHADELKRVAVAGRDHVRQRYSYEATTRDLVAWASEPRHAPDNAYKLRRHSSSRNPLREPSNPVEGPPQACFPAPLPFRPAGSAAGRVVQRGLGASAFERLRFLHRLWQERLLPREAVRIESPDADHGTPIAGAPHIVFAPGAAASPKSASPVACVLRTGNVRQVTIEDEGTDPAGIDSLAGSLVEDAPTNARLVVRVIAHGTDRTHNEALGRASAWRELNTALMVLNGIRSVCGGRMGIEVLLRVTERNWREARALDSHMHRTFRVRTLFEPAFVGEGLPSKSRTALVRSLYSIRRRRGYCDPWSAPGMAVALDEGRTRVAYDDLPPLVTGSVGGLFALISER